MPTKRATESRRAGTVITIDPCAPMRLGENGCSASISRTLYHAIRLLSIGFSKKFRCFSINFQFLVSNLTSARTGACTTALSYCVILSCDAQWVKCRGDYCQIFLLRPPVIFNHWRFSRKIRSIFVNFDTLQIRIFGV